MHNAYVETKVLADYWEVNAHRRSCRKYQRAPATKCCEILLLMVYLRLFYDITRFRSARSLISTGCLRIANGNPIELNDKITLKRRESGYVFSDTHPSLIELTSLKISNTLSFLSVILNVILSVILSVTAKGTLVLYTQINNLQPLALPRILYAEPYHTLCILVILSNISNSRLRIK